MKIPCPQCGGEVQLRDAEGFPACPFCSAGLVLDRTGVRPHLLYQPRVTPEQVTPLLRRWGEKRGLAVSPGAGAPRLVFYPFWRYAKAGPRRLVPAWSTLEPEWATLRLPDAEQVYFDVSLLQGAKAVEPTVPEAAARARAAHEPASLEGDLVHLPVYEKTLRLDDRQVSVAVEACSGAVVGGGTLAGAAERHAPMRRFGWIAAAGLGVLGAAIVIAPFALAAAVSAIVVGLLYSVLAAEGRGSGN